MQWRESGVRTVSRGRALRACGAVSAVSDRTALQAGKERKRMHDQGRNQWRLMPQTYRKRDDRAAVMPTGAAVEWAVCEGDLVCV